MRTREKHLAPDEIVAHVFPTGDRPAEAPAHLADCAACREAVARLREAWLLDRGAADGVVDALPEAFWANQKEAVLRRLREDAAQASPTTSGLHPFPASVRNSRLLRRPVLAIGSLAAALALVAGLSYTRLKTPERSAALPQAVLTPALAATPASDQSDDELLLSIERVLREDPPYTSLVPDETT